jgi:hypothetical protein
MDEPKPKFEGGNRDGVGIGLLIGIGLHIVAGGLILLAISLVDQEYSAGALVVCGLTQLIYLVPAMLIERSKQRPKIVRGIVLVAAITFLLNASCWGLVMGTLTH